MAATKQRSSGGGKRVGGSGGGSMSPHADDLPKLSWACFSGDIAAVRACLRAGGDVHEAVALLNQNHQNVVNVTPLYLAAQNGHLEVCRELLAAGADALRPCNIPATGQSFGPADIALVHFHIRTWWLLREAGAARQRAAARFAERRGRLGGGEGLAQPLVGLGGGGGGGGGALAV
ncbi:hypothetical protein Rsub_07875 [Raphidocelis subcapitata]|uniref:Uncharacterized protein n=1 Tax=Raphidocelis subcapitata TaxID=307507 RepID=A0A2V0P896_9CHLO|nr:hypothetical protein Rsub_07875 [Raphidocelis subcapitata]|eukprot:GBF95162.1 hypothetical protein Rsub_07875 [Raphidocelis subcapitata]